MAVIFTQTWDSVLGGTDFSNASRITSPTYSGAGALQLQPTAAVSYWEQNAVGGAQRVMVARVFIRFAVFPAIDVRIIHAEPGNDVAISYDSATGQLGCTYNDGFTGGLGGPVLQLNTWYDIDFYANLEGATLTADGKVNGSALPQVSGAGGPGTYGAYKVGPNNAVSTMTLIYDQLQVSHIVQDFPLSSFTTTVAWLGA